MPETPRKPIGSDFIWVVAGHTIRCSECGKKVAPSEKSLVSIRNGKVQKRVCSEGCRLTFDANYWGAVADERNPE